MGARGYRKLPREGNYKSKTNDAVSTFSNCLVLFPAAAMYMFLVTLSVSPCRVVSLECLFSTPFGDISLVTTASVSR